MVVSAKLIQYTVGPLKAIESIILRFATRIGHAYAATDRTCEEDGCNNPIFFWMNGKRCIVHSRDRRVPTVLVVIVAPKAERNKK